ncbi:helix-turn-helix transcriptional regulator [Streptomyces sp. B-S-A8]|uniref:Helix-turn-helix transcriptional regulator n=1 Tax=Streptomyces solicavernae TaxID=3043614 RepID=A0ABT6S0C7_9ACTN|nr:helix-turn-helix transcriptional regulator [Streptomyces sp. B-S-A8]MDI3390030.1 helix-turn-helix transcriptional regulator [Streptomyces sp. B-S-A8]
MDDLIRHPLAHARRERGWTQPELARQVRRVAEQRGLRSGVDRQRIWTWENDRATPDEDSQILLADAFEVDQSLITELGWPYWLPGRDHAIPLGPDSTVPALREALRTMDRRTFLTYSSASLVGLAHQWATNEPQALSAALDGKTIDTELVDLLEATGHRLTSLVTEQRQHTRTLLDAHLTTITDLIDGANYSQPVGQRLHTLAAHLAQTVAWHRFDQGEHGAAGRYWHAALHSAHTSGDRDLGAGIMSDLAYQATWLTEPKTAAEILESAVARIRHPTARALLHLRLARSQAALGAARACRTSLSTAERELARTADEPPAWCSWMSGADLLVDSGQCLADLGELEHAHQLIGEGAALLPAARSKTRSVFLSYEAGSFLKVGEADQAAAAATQSLTLAEKIGAPRCVALVRDLAPEFKKYAGVDAVDDLLDRVRAA